MSRTDKGSWEIPKPYHPGSRQVEAAKWLRIAANRFLQGKDSAAQVSAAIGEWVSATTAEVERVSRALAKEVTEVDQ